MQTAGRPVYSSDLYSLGLTAIYLITGKIPQELACDPSTGEILWRQYAPSVTPSFAAFLDKAIQSYAGVDAKRLVVRHRFSTAKEMLQALQTGTTGIASSAPQPNPTVISAPVAGGYVHPPTVVAPTAGIPSQQGYYQHSPAKGMSDLQKALITGGVIGACVFGGLWLTRGQQSIQPVAKQSPSPVGTTLPSQPSVTPTQETTSSQPITPTTPVQLDVTTQVPTSSPQKPTQPVSIGWLRVGSVNNTSGNFIPKEQLIQYIQPVTISPGVVPEPHSQVILTTNVNLRSNLPQPPDYKLTGKITTLKAQQRLVILRVKSFVDPNSESPLTKVWAEVALPN